MRNDLGSAWTRAVVVCYEAVEFVVEGKSRDYSRADRHLRSAGRLSRLAAHFARAGGRRLRWPGRCKSPPPRGALADRGHRVAATVRRLPRVSVLSDRNAARIHN